MFKDILLRHSPGKGLRLNYKITYNMSGEKYGGKILDSSLDLMVFYNVLDVDQDKTKLSLVLEEGTFLKNNMNKDIPYKGDNLSLILNKYGNILERSSHIPWGFLDYINFPFPEKDVNIGSNWECTCRTVFPNIRDPVEIKGEFSFLRFKTYKAYNCCQISFAFIPRTIELTPDFKQILTGNGYILFDPNYSVAAFISLNTKVDTGDLGLIFKSTLKQEVGPFAQITSSQSSSSVTSSIISSPDEYFFAGY